MPQEDPYKILGVDRNATHEDIKKAYRALSLKFHPDKNQGKPEAETIYKSINGAYEILGDETRRKEYDNPMPPPHMNPFGGMGMPTNFPFAGMGMPGANAHHEFMKIFSSGIFQNMGGMDPGTTQIFTMGPNGPIRVHVNQQPQKPQPITKIVEITMDKAYSGCSLPIEITRWVLEGGMKKEEKETLYITIPRGVDDNEMIVLTGKGNAISEDNRGDVKIQIKVKNDTQFKRDGLDLILERSISLKEALCGFNFEMKFIDGRVFKINNDNGNVICPGYKKLVNGLGIARDDKIGNLIIHFNIVFPEHLSSEAIAAISGAL
jgi:DnaJ-class molecular chaperone